MPYTVLRFDWNGVFVKVVKRIISGGQTGADQGGLEAAEILGIERGGVAPRKWLTETGSNPKLLRDRFGLIECATRGYPPRTKANILVSDGTVIFGDVRAPGSRLTTRLCDELQKPRWWCLWPFLQDDELRMMRKQELATFRTWIIDAKVETLNVAGNRESRNPGIQVFVREFLVEALKEEPK